MTQATANAEELFRFATTRAPNPTQAQAGLLELPDQSNIAAWIADPQAPKPGNNMPKVPLSPSELDAVTAYLETLK